MLSGPRRVASVLVALGLVGIATSAVMSASSHAQRWAERPAEEVAAALQARYDGVRDFSASFLHTYEGGLLRTSASERGTVLIKKPGMMRWTYAEPEHKVFVSDGERMYSYVPADKQVVINAVPPDDQAGAPVLFLAGKGNLLRDFTVTLAEPSDEIDSSSLTLALTPRAVDPSYDALELVVDAETLQIRRIVTLDAQGGRSAVTFSNIRENLGIPDSSFAFEIPRGVDVISNDALQ